MSENPSGEGDLVVLALICLGLTMNLGFGLIMYINSLKIGGGGRGQNKRLIQALSAFSNAVRDEAETNKSI